MYKERIFYRLGIAYVTLAFIGCSVPALVQKDANTSVPETYNRSRDTLNSVNTRWKEFFNDPYLSSLIDTALQKNQELNITMQEIEIARNEIRARKGEYLPSV